MKKSFRYCRRLLNLAIALGLLWSLTASTPSSAQDGPQCPPGFHFDRMSGVGCVQDDCLSISGARYSYTPLLSALLSLLLLGLFWLLSGAHLNGLVALPIFVLGLGLGGLIGLTARLYPQGNRVMGRHSWLFLAGWGFSLVLAQLLVLTGWPLAASLGLIPLIFSTGSNAGRELSLFIRRWMMSPGPV